MQYILLYNHVEGIMCTLMVQMKEMQMDWHFAHTMCPKKITLVAY